MKHAIRFGGTVHCDHADCAAAFVTYSEARLARAQAVSHGGWSRTLLNRLPLWWTLELGSNGRRKLDLCPLHAVAADAPAIVKPREGKASSDHVDLLDAAPNSGAAA